MTAARAIMATRLSRGGQLGHLCLPPQIAAAFNGPKALSLKLTATSCTLLARALASGMAEVQYVHSPSAADVGL